MSNKNNEFLEQYNSIKETFKTMDPKLVEYTLFKFFLEKEDEKNNIKDLFKDDVKNIDVMYFLSLVINILKKSTNKKIKLIEENTTSKENYKQILIKSKKLALELNLKNSLEIANLYTYLLCNGYFSKDKELKYRIEKRLLLPAMYSNDIMSGFGVCLNFSDMLTDFINQFDYSCATLLNKYNNGIKKSYSPEIERQIVKPKFYNKFKSILYEPLTKKIGNHAFNLIKENNKFYIYDSTNLTALNFDNIKKGRIIAGKGTCDIKPLYSYAINYSKKAVDSLNDFNLASSLESPYNRKDFINTWEECFELFYYNEYLLDSFHDDINNNINNICENNKTAKKIIKKYKNK